MTKAKIDLPRVTLKLATSLDGYIATKSGASQWITGPQARAHVHEMRAAHDCVLTGIGTVLADDPVLTARTNPLPKSQPLRAVLDSNSKMPLGARMLATAHVGPICLFHGVGWSKDKPELANQPIHRCYVGRNKRPDFGLDLHDVLVALKTGFGVKSVMVEAGARVATAFLRAGFVNELVWFRAPILIGSDGLAGIGELGVLALDEAIKLEPVSITSVGPDRVETYLVTRKKGK